MSLIEIVHDNVPFRGSGNERKGGGGGGGGGRLECTVLSRKSAHGRCILLSHQTRGWALFRVFPHSTLKERPPLFTYTSRAIAAIEQQARVSQSPPSTSTSSLVPRPRGRRKDGLVSTARASAAISGIFP